MQSAAAGYQAPRPSYRGITLPNIWAAGFGYQRYLGILILVGFGLRLVLLDRFRFHQDEALYSYWALRFLHGDPYFLDQWIDKPPLFIWLLAVWFKAFGASEASARLLNVGISILTIPVVGAIARRAWSPVAGAVAATAYALNPFAISYSPTAFTDPLLVLAGVCSLYAALRSRPFLAGLCLGAAIMTKQQGVFFAPLTLAVLLARNPESIGASTLRAVGGLALAALPVLYWDSLRWAVAPSPWDLAVRNYGALALLPVGQWPGRFVGIAELLWYLTASSVVWAVLGAAAALAAVYSWRQGNPWPRRAVFAVLLCGWIGAYWAVHAAFSLPIWDRYFLPLAPAFALLCGWAGGRIAADRGGLWRPAVVGLVIALLLPGAGRAARGELPIGGDHGAYDGLQEATAWLDGHSPPGTIVYHQALSWHFQFYLFEKPGEYSARWFASPVALADDAAKRPQRARFVIVPAWRPLRNAYPHLAARGMALEPRVKEEQFTVYEIILRRR